MNFQNGILIIVTLLTTVTMKESYSQLSDPARLIRKIRRHFDVFQQEENDASVYDPYGGALHIQSNTDPETGITYISSLNRRPASTSPRINESDQNNSPRARQRKKRKPQPADPIRKERTPLAHRSSTAQDATPSFGSTDYDTSPTEDLGQDVSYPTFSRIPRTGFKCSSQRYPGYYADTKARCQVFHICQADGRQNSILCPNGTLFNQQYFTCDWWFNVDCNTAESFYELNSNLYQEINTLDDDVEDVDKYFVSGSSYGRGQGYKIFRRNPPERITSASNALNSALWLLRVPSNRRFS